MEGRQRNKRSFTEMSQAATLSPSPISFGNTASNFLGRAGPSTSSNDTISFRRRQRGSIEMAEASQSQRPRLEHRQSQTIIDLTDDVDDVPAPIRDPPHRSRPSRPPQLGRSDGSRLQDIVDLTDDSDFIFTGERQLPPRRPIIAPPAAPRTPPPPPFVPNRPQHARANGVVASPNTRGVITGAFHHMGAMGVLPGGLRNFLGIHVYHHEGPYLPPQVMPGPMDYQHMAFAERKPDHVAPPQVASGFTRSPTDDDMVICPSCEEELIHRKEDEEPPVKKGGKAPSRKDREEHPFWVVKECGHVYCNKCFQLRQQASKHDQVNFCEVEKTTTRKSKILTCNVEDCQSDVKSKEKWVGIFL